MRLTGLALILVLWSGLLQAATEIKLPVPEIETLPNGLQVVWFLNQNLPVVDLGVLVKSGYRDDAKGRSGTAMLVSSLLDRGAAGKSALEIAKAIESLGAGRSASADEDSFSVGVHGLAPDAPALLDLLSQMVVKPDFPEAEFKRSQARTLDEWEHIGDSPETLVSIAYRKILLSGTVYGRGALSSVAELSKITREDVLEYHKKHFTPRNAILMVVGQVDRVLFRQQIEKVFGGWSGEAPKHDTEVFKNPKFQPRKNEILVVDRPGLPQAQVRLGFRSPLFQSPDHYPLVVANALLGEYFYSRLNALIRDKLGLTYSIGSGFSYSKELAYFTISSATRNESVGQLLRKSMDVVKDLKRGPIPVEEVRMAKEYLVGGFPLGTATLGAVASRWLGGYIFDLGPGYLNEFVPKIEKVTPADVVQALSRGFNLDQWVVVVAGSAKEIEKSLSAAKLGPVRRVSANDLK